METLEDYVVLVPADVDMPPQGGVLGELPEVPGHEGDRAEGGPWQESQDLRPDLRWEQPPHPAVILGV